MVVGVLIGGLTVIFGVPIIGRVGGLLNNILKLTRTTVLIFFTIGVFSKILRFSGPRVLGGPVVSNTIFGFFDITI